MRVGRKRGGRLEKDMVSGIAGAATQRDHVPGRTRRIQQRNAIKRLSGFFKVHPSTVIKMEGSGD